MKTKRIVLTAAFIAMVTVSTYIRIYIPIGTGGLIHLGTLVSFTIAIKFGRRYGAVSGGIGMALFDVLSEWYVWAPGTLVIRLVAGYLVGLVAMSPRGQGQSRVRNVFAILAGGVVIVSGYFVFEAVFLGTGWAAIMSVPGNLTQIAIGFFSLFIVAAIPRLEDLEN